MGDLRGEADARARRLSGARGLPGQGLLLLHGALRPLRAEREDREADEASTSRRGRADRLRFVPHLASGLNAPGDASDRAATPIPALGARSHAARGARDGLYTVAAYIGRPGSIGVGVGTALALSITQLGDRHLGLANSVAAYVFFGGAWLLGDRLGARRAYLRELEERAVRLQQERQENERRAAAAEQARIARELHDIITHNVSVMTVQAAAAGDVFETQPNRAREALASIESTGREALTELRRLLGTVRPDDGASSFDPQPRLARLDALLEQIRGAGLGVELTVEGEPRHLPAGVDLSAYRIVQEALTNTLKHAQASHVTVLVRYGTRAVELDVVDDGAGPATDGRERGYGIIGMRERAALFGGKLEAGPVPGGGFSVRAHIPLGEDTT